jgi:hypothetical protein
MGFTTLINHKGFKKAHLARRMAELSQGPSLYWFVGNNTFNHIDRFGLDSSPGYSPEECAEILNQIDFLFSLKGRTGMNDNSLQQQINDLQDEYDENCGDDDDPPNPNPQPQPVPSCPTQNPQPSPVKQTCFWVTVGVVAYWVCSETTRILFPPRNFIPVP